MGDVYPKFAAGLRRISPQSVSAAATAERFDGLPADRSRGQVLAAFKRAAPQLGIAPRLRDAVDVLMSYSQPQDWAADSRPIVWPSNLALQDQLGLCRRQVQYLLRDLVAEGLIVPVDSPTGRRWGHRHPSTGKIVEAYGFDLSPLAVRFDEFLAAAERGREERAIRAGLRRRLTIARKAIRQIGDSALEHDLADRDWEAWTREALRMAREAGEEMPIDTTRAVVVALEGVRKEGETALRAAFLSEETAPSDAPNCTPITTTNQPPADKSATRKPDSGEGCSPGGGALPPEDRSISESAELEAHKITPRFVLRVSPTLQPYVISQRPTWTHIVEAADWVRAELGISRPAWTEACSVMGRYAAAAAVAVIAAKSAEIRSAGGYLRAMTDRARSGDLHLSKSFYGLAERQRQQLT